MSISIAENLTWEKHFALVKNSHAAFPWDEWITCIPDYTDLPVYDLNQILDASAAYDMVQHARYFGNDRLRYQFRINASLATHLKAVELNRPGQVQYFCYALYSHCAKYTAGMAPIALPPTTHMDVVPIIPNNLFERLNAELRYPVGLYCWIENVILFGKQKPFLTQVRAKKSHAPSGRRQRKYAAEENYLASQEQLVCNVTSMLEEIYALSPTCIPKMQCVVQSTASLANMNKVIHLAITVCT